MYELRSTQIMRDHIVHVILRQGTTPQESTIQRRTVIIPLLFELLTVPFTLITN